MRALVTPAPAARRRMGEARAAHVATQYTWARGAELLEAIYRRVT